MVGQPRVGPYGADAGLVDGHRLAGGTGVGRVTGLVAPAQREFLEAVVVGDGPGPGVEHVLVPVPDLGTGGTLTLLDDLLQGGERRAEVGDRSEVPRRVDERAAGDLTGRVPDEDLVLAQFGAQVPQALSIAS